MREFSQILEQIQMREISHTPQQEQICEMYTTVYDPPLKSGDEAGDATSELIASISYSLYRIPLLHGT